MSTVKFARTNLVDPQLYKLPYVYNAQHICSHVQGCQFGVQDFMVLFPGTQSADFCYWVEIQDILLQKSVSSSWVKIRLHTENKLPRLSGSALKVLVVGWVVQLITLSTLTTVELHLVMFFLKVFCENFF